MQIMKKICGQLSDIPRVIRAFIRRDDIILVDENRAAKEQAVNIHWRKISSEEQNVGDMLSPVVVEYMIHRLGLPDTAPKKRHLIAIGSLIDTSYQDATIWGSGVLVGSKKWWWRNTRKLDVRCVRGPETRKVLLENGYACPECYGDPAILMPLVYPAKEGIQKEFAYRVVQHHSCNDKVANALSPVTADWKEFIDSLLKSELIISSSLHGIILAEAYGIPAILLNDKNMNLFKYRDYYHSTGRTVYPIASSVEEALSMVPPPLPKLDAMRQQLMDLFPRDLWE